jgi:tripeptidyl-peptidase I
VSPCYFLSFWGASDGAGIPVAYSTGGLNPTFVPDTFTNTDSDEPYLDWVNYILDTEDIPQMISTSYGDDEQTVSKAYAVQVCNQFAQFGARGVSLLFASGDYGVGASRYCYSNDGLGTPEFLPGFPNDCPYVTDVGATAFYPQVAAYDPRFKTPFTSGAGFSNYFAQPSWQSKAVDGYIASLNGEYDGLYNKSGRAYPDIAALGQIFAVVWNGSVIRVDGSSAATPTAAGVLTLVNDALIAAGRPPLGFLNPWLYAHGHKAFTGMSLEITPTNAALLIFQDVTSGSSAGCNTTGFPAKAGWDAVTGWGTPVSIFRLVVTTNTNHSIVFPRHSGDSWFVRLWRIEEGMSRTKTPKHDLSRFLTSRKYLQNSLSNRT